MKTIEIQGSLRKETGKKESRQLRKKGLVPCVIYGGEQVMHFYAEETDLSKIIHTPEVYVVKLDLDGERRQAVMSELQLHPVTDHIIHMDFYEVSADKKVSVNLPIALTGDSAGLLAGGKLRQRRRNIKVRGLVEHLPERLEVDITHLEIGDSLKIGDLEYANLEILDPERAMVVGVVSSRLVAKGLRETVEEEEAAAAIAAELAEGEEEEEVSEAAEGEEEEEEEGSTEE